MRYVLTIVEQLDRAARELVTDHPINNRLALILVDNATDDSCCIVNAQTVWNSTAWHRVFGKRTKPLLKKDHLRTTLHSQKT